MTPATDLLPRCALTRYDEHGDPLLSTAERILLRLRWFDWVSTYDLCESMDLDVSDRNAVASVMSRLVKSGRVQRREGGTGHGSSYEYRLVKGARKLRSA